MTLGSLFDGIGGFCLAGSLLGIEPVWASEIFPECISITKRHFPNTKHLGDITKLNGSEIEPVDIITGGSPCQNLSQAGNRKGLVGDESALFFEMIRIISEMRKSTKGQFPKYAVWENVFGAFSSNNGEDFRAVLQEFVGVCDDKNEIGLSVPRSSEGGWLPAGTVLGNGWSIAWRCMDAQYWSVPQRRNRIFLVVDFRGRSASEILYKPESEGWDYPQSKKQRQGVSPVARTSIKAAGFDNYNSRLSEDVSPTLGSNCGMSTGRSTVLVYENHGADSRIKELKSVFPTVTKHWGTGGNGTPFVQTIIEENQSQVIGVDSELNNFKDKTGVLKSQNRNNIVAIPINDRATRHKSKSSNGLGIGKEGDPFPTLDSSSHHSVAYCIQGNTIGRSDNAGAEGKGVNEDVSFTLTGTDRHAVAYQQTVGTLCKDDAKGINSQYINQDKCIVTDNFAIRRLTPRECERLMDFPDDWTRYGHDDKEISDSKRYQMIGNSVVIPCVHRVLWGIKEVTYLNNGDIS